MKKPLDKCCNGCDKPPKPPSWVLCEDCFEELDRKMHVALSPGKFATHLVGGTNGPKESK